ncbi:MAG: hypothetical protein R3F56_15135 [Planctomycetota bacterium]
MTAAPSPGLTRDDSERLQEQDRWFGRLASVRTDVERELLSVALRGLDELRRDRQGPGSATQLAILDQEVHEALDQALRRLEVDIEAGNAPAAALRVGRLTQDLHPQVDVSLREFVFERRWPRMHAVAIPATLERSGGAPLAPRRRVTARVGDASVDAEIVQGSAPDGRVTVRVESEAGVSFPELSQAEVAPVAPTPAELAAQLRAALAAGRADLSSAWLAACVAGGAAVPSDLRAGLDAWFRHE